MPSVSPPSIGIVTGATVPELTSDGRALRSALDDRGFDASAVRWDDPSTDWDCFDALCLRSCWEYHEDVDAFLAWLATVDAAGVQVFNRPRVVRWNVHKRYLLDLADAGAPVVPTAVVERGSDESLAAVADRRDWTDVVVKPAVGTSSTGVWRTDRPGSPDARRRFRDRLDAGDLLVQEFVPEIADGEYSFVFLRGTYSHASRCVPADGAFRAHHTHGASSSPIVPQPTVTAQAKAVLDAAADVLSIDPSDFVYARVDGVERDGSLAVLEVELIEAYLGLERSDGGVDRFVDAFEAAFSSATTTGVVGR